MSRGFVQQAGAAPGKVRYWLTTDSDMSYSVFVGPEAPRVDRLSGRARWVGNNNCRMLFVSVGDPYFFANHFGIALDALNCVELGGVHLERLGQAVSQVHPQPFPFRIAPGTERDIPQGVGGEPVIEPIVAEAACAGPGPDYPRFIEKGNGQFLEFQALRAGAWFLLRCGETNADLPCTKLDEGMCVVYDRGDAVLEVVDPGELVIPITPTFNYVRTYPPRDPRMN